MIVHQSQTTETSPDQDLERRVTDYLRGIHRQPLLRIGVQAQNGTVILSGTVPTFYDKQLCLLCRRRVLGVSDLGDNIRVSEAQEVRVARVPPHPVNTCCPARRLATRRGAAKFTSQLSAVLCLAT